MKPYGPEEIVARAMTAHERGDPNAGSMMFTALARHFDAPHPDEVAASIVDGKLVLTRGAKSFSMTPHLTSKFSLTTVVSELLKPPIEEPKCPTPD